MKLSIIVPVLSNKDREYLLVMLSKYRPQKNIEFIVVGEKKLVESISDVTSLSSEKTNRAGQFNIGLTEAHGETVLLHHPRTIIDSKGISHLLEHDNYSWGGFTHSFDRHGIGYVFTSWYSNILRADLRSIFYFDHCIFVKRELLLSIGGVPDKDIFEDTALSLLLRKSSKGKRVKLHAKTSSARFLKKGFFKQSFLNQLLKLGYFLGFSDKKMNMLYERELN